MNKRQFSPAPNDATLPKTRKELFRDVLKYDFALTVDLGLVIALFSVPLYALWLVALILLAGQAEPSLSSVFPVCFYGGLLSVPLFAVRYLGKGAAFEVMKKRAFNQGFYVWETAFSSVKNNAGKFLSVGVIVGVAAWLSLLGGVYSLTMVQSAVAKGVCVGLCVLLFAVVFCAASCALCQNAIYSLSVWQLLKNGVTFTFIAFLPAMLYFAVCVAVPFVVASLSIIAAVLVAIVFVTLVSGVSVCCCTLVCHGLFDKYINAAHYPELVRKGLFNEKEQ